MGCTYTVDQPTEKCVHGLYICITFSHHYFLSPPCRTPDLSDLAETFPSVGHSLEELLKYNGDNFTTTFDLNFTVSFHTVSNF